MSVVLSRAAQAATGRGRLGRVLFTVIAGISALLLVLAAVRIVTTARIRPIPVEEGVLTVETTTVRHQPMPVLLESVGQVVSQHTVQVRPQISGLLKQVYFTEGQSVIRGQKLFLIEAAPFEAALISARAAWESAKANAQRLIPLEKQGYVTPQDSINARTTADQAEAAYKQAKINLAYTDVRAPISGRTGSLGVKAGNVVSPSDGVQLITINEIQPIQVQFNIPQRLLPVVRQYQAQHGVKVAIARDDDAVALDEGVLIFIDNAVNTSTGTVMLKARMPNRREQLWPGQYVSVHMQLAVDPQAVVVPQTAVQTGQGGNYVYVVTAGEAATQAVRVDREVGTLAVIASGLSGGEQVVVRVPRSLRPGIRVAPAGGAAPASAEITLPNEQ